MPTKIWEKYKKKFSSNLKIKIYYGLPKLVAATFHFITIIIILIHIENEEQKCGFMNMYSET